MGWLVDSTGNAKGLREPYWLVDVSGDGKAQKGPSI